MIIYLIILIIIYLFLEYPYGSQSNFKINFSMFNNIKFGIIKTLHIEGIVHLNIKVCEDNLLLLNKIMNENNIPFWLSEGTALGAVRDNAIIPWDDDVDISFMYEYYQTFVNIVLPILKKNNFIVCGIGHNGNFIGLIRNNEKVDIDIVQVDSLCMAGTTKNANTVQCNDIIPYISKLKSITFLNNTFNVPGDNYFNFLYGPSWKTPQIIIKII